MYSLIEKSKMSESQISDAIMINALSIKASNRILWDEISNGIWMNDVSEGIIIFLRNVSNSFK